MCKCKGNKCIYTSMTYFNMKREKYAIDIANLNTWIFQTCNLSKN